MADMTKEAMDMFNNPNASKVLATVDVAGKIHAVPHGSIMAVAPDKVAFAKLLKGKTQENLQSTKNASVTVFVPSQQPGESIGYQVKGIFEGIQESGPLFDNYQSKMPPNMKLAGVGTIKVEEVYEVSPGPNCGKRLA
ncbi:MAG: pyridoxamine 5'-phosphate oxidase family protein [Syntrophales bacterium]